MTALPVCSTDMILRVLQWLRELVSTVFFVNIELCLKCRLLSAKHLEFLLYSIKGELGICQFVESPKGCGYCAACNRPREGVRHRWLH